MYRRNLLSTPSREEKASGTPCTCVCMSPTACEDAVTKIIFYQELNSLNPVTITVTLYYPRTVIIQIFQPKILCSFLISSTQTIESKCGNFVMGVSPARGLFPYEGTPSHVKLGIPNGDFCPVIQTMTHLTVSC